MRDSTTSHTRRGGDRHAERDGADALCARAPRSCVHSVIRRWRGRRRDSGRMRRVYAGRVRARGARRTGCRIRRCSCVLHGACGERRERARDDECHRAGREPAGV